MPSYSDQEKIIIAKSYMMPKILAESSLTPDDIIVDDDVWSHVVRPLGFDPGIRTLQRNLQAMVRKILRAVLEGKVKQDNGPFKVTAENIKEFLPT